MKKLKVVLDSPYTIIGSYTRVNPYTIAFVYHPAGNGVVLKGGLNNVEVAIEKRKGPALVNYTMWHHGKHRSFWRLKNVVDVHLEFTFIKDNIKKYGRPYVIKHRDGSVIKKLRRIPRCWIKELNAYI